MQAPHSRARAFLQDAPKILEQGVGWAGLGGDGLAFALARTTAKGRWLVIVDEPDLAELVARGLRFFHPSPSRVVVLPADDVRPYDGFSPSPGVLHQRIATLDAAEQGGPIVVIAPARALQTRVAHRQVRQRGTVELAKGETLDRDVLVGALTDGGYLAVSRVADAGTYAVRGDVVDLWPVGLPGPVRVDFFDDEIEALFQLDPQTNRTTRRSPRVRVLPAREDRVDGHAQRRAAEELTRHVHDQRRGQLLRRRVVEDLRAGVRFSAIEDWLPALVPVQDPLDVLADLRRILVSPEDVAATVRELERSARDRYKVLDDEERPLVPPEDRFVSAATMLAALAEAHPVTDLAMEGQAVDFGARTVQGWGVHGTELAPVVARLRDLAGDGARVGLVVRNERRAEAIAGLLEPHAVMAARVSHPDDLRPSAIHLLVGDLPRGFVAPDSGWAFIPASALFGGNRRSATTDRVHAFFDAAVSSVSQLKEGDHVVHRLHGVGLFRGLVRVGVQGIGDFRARAEKAEQDYVRLEYRDGDLLYLPATRLKLLSRFVPARGTAKVKLDKLGGQTWAARKGKVRDSILAMAEELLRTQARREIADREALPEPGSMYAAFEARFPYEETPDQAVAIEVIQDDLGKPFPMDRLLCGDVGFGKTEVAMRAAMRVVESGGQVAVLCPTTVLAFQHLTTFRERFEAFDVRVEMLSRFNNPAEDKAAMAAVRTGAAQIVVGTTRLLARGVTFADLALVVVDEEHRFGVRQKERLKKLRAEVHVLSMSATPIPRTLQMGLSGVRDMSLMATPPVDRLEVRTTIARFSQARVADAIRQEVLRGGQVFFVHNRVETIARLADKLRTWVPEARFAVAHGQMDDTELEDVLVQFIRHEHDVLVCTAIMESGVDMPNANTMLVHRADLFGVAQLYQLRGRVGRSSVRASCILLVPEELTREGRRRIQVLVDNTRLGSGFHVAAADLELRGAGNLVGDKQSGNIDAVGYEVWLSMLQDAVSAARGRVEAEQIEAEVNVPVDAFLPEKLLPDLHERLGWYRRLSDAGTVGHVDQMLEELEELSGELPKEVYNLAGLAQTQVSCRDLGITRLTWLKVRVVLDLHRASPLQAKLARLVTVFPKRAEVRDGEETRISLRFTPKEAEHPFRFLRWLFARLADL